MAQVKNVNDWARAQLHDLGIPPSRGAMQILVGWAKAEGGNWHNDAHHNPLNTTQPMAGAGNTGSQGNIKQYRDWQQGIKATTRTLRNGRYDHIIGALRTGDVDAGVQAISSSPWGTGGGLVAQTIRGTSGNLPTAPLAVTSPSGPSGGGDTAAGAPTTSTRTSQRLVAPAIDNKAARAALVYNFLKPGAGHQKDLLGFVSQAQRLEDVPAQYATDTKTTTIPGTPGVRSGGGPNVAAAGGLAASATERANVIDKQGLPYRWGGGHAGKTPLHQAIPLDCSGAVSKILGIDPRVSGGFGKWGRPGDGGNKGVTVYSNPHHVFMKINGHFFGTSGANPQGGAGWIPQERVSPQYLQGFTARHSER